MRDWERVESMRTGRMGGRMVTCLLMVIFIVVSLAVENVKARMIQPVSEIRASDSEPGFLHRSDFPEGFVFGSSSSSYQYEGAVAEGGRGPSVWDTFTHKQGSVADNTTGDQSADQYHRYAEDVELMADLGMDAYRFSISWSRILPDGSGRVNSEGLAYYNRLIDALLVRGIQPWVVLYHFDLPQALQDSFGGWMSPEVAPLFGAFAGICFAAFGDRVKYWGTFNEIHHAAFVFPNVGCRAPSGICGDPRSQPYIIAHHMLLSHAKAVGIYRTKFQTEQKGKIGLILDCQWYEPISELQEDIDATDRMLAFHIQWIMDPLVHGHYPPILHNLLKDRLPNLTKSDSKALKGSFDFIGLNHYTTHWTQNLPNGSIFPQYDVEMYDAKVAISAIRDGVLIGPQAGSPWLQIVPWGMGRVLNQFKVLYNNPLIYITENGVDEAEEPGSPREKSLQDKFRTKYHHDYLVYVLDALRNGSNIRGYFVWSLLDNFEWVDGLCKRFGLFYVDYKDFTRHPKSSVKWFRELLRKDDENHTTS